MISMIAAQGLHREIGLDGKMPWSLPGDSEHFKKLTQGHTMLMGRRTFDSLPGVLPGRMHIIISRDPNFRKDHKRVKIRPDLEECLREAATSEEEVFVIGGGVIYEAALPYAEKVYLTQIQRSFEADTYFPRLGAEWELIREEPVQQLPGDEAPYCFQTYQRRKST